MKMARRSRSFIFVLFLALVLGLGACGKKEGTAPSGEGGAGTPMSDIGIGPIKQKITLGALDPEKAAKGEAIFKAKCSACHKIDEKYVGPALKGVTQRRASEWILNQILNPTEMTQKDPIAKDLLAAYMTQMTPQNLTEEEARQVLEYFRQVDSQTPKP
ncbi:MAG: cytochrome c [bacterium]